MQQRQQLALLLQLPPLVLLLPLLLPLLLLGLCWWMRGRSPVLWLLGGRGRRQEARRPGLAVSGCAGARGRLSHGQGQLLLWPAPCRLARSQPGAGHGGGLKVVVPGATRGPGGEACRVGSVWVSVGTGVKGRQGRRETHGWIGWVAATLWWSLWSIQRTASLVGR